MYIVSTWFFSLTLNVATNGIIPKPYIIRCLRAVSLCKLSSGILLEVFKITWASMGIDPDEWFEPRLIAQPNIQEDT